MLQLLLNQKLIFGLMGGLGLFLFGMKIMSEGLQKIAGERMRKILAALTNNRVVGALVGIGVTAIIQSGYWTSITAIRASIVPISGGEYFSPCSFARSAAIE